VLFRSYDGRAQGSLWEAVHEIVTTEACVLGGCHVELCPCLAPLPHPPRLTLIMTLTRFRNSRTKDGEGLSLVVATSSTPPS